MTAQRTRQIEGPCSAPRQLKKPLKGLRQRLGNCLEEQRRRVFPDKRQNDDFVTEKNELVARPAFAVS